MGDVKSEIKDGKAVLAVDADQDGATSIKCTLHLSEAVAEAISRGEKIEGAKVVDFQLGSRIVLAIDTDKDGEKALELEIDLMETYDEISKAIKKD